MTTLKTYKIIDVRNCANWGDVQYLLETFYAGKLSGISNCRSEDELKKVESAMKSIGYNAINL